MKKKFDVQRIAGDLRSEVSVPEGKCGDWTISYATAKAGSLLTVVSLRNSLFMGFEPMKVKVPNPFKITLLKEGDGVWMSDSPQEIFLHHMAIEAARGDVLIGGLGIGYSAQKIARKKSVRSVTVVEKQSEVISLVEPHIGFYDVELIHANLFDFLKVTKRKFDFCFFDIWCSTGEMEYQRTVKPLRELGKKVLKRGGQIKCWGEEEMQGQVDYNKEVQKKCLTLKNISRGKNVVSA